MAQRIRVDYNALPPFGHAEGPSISPSPYMRQEYYLREDACMPQLNSDTTAANLPREPASIDQAHERPDPHVPVSGKQLIGLVLFSFTFASCVSNARLVNETAVGGTVLYSYVEERDVLTSPGRKDALRLVEEKCPAGYRIIRQEEVPTIDRAVDRAWSGQVSRDGQVSREKRWAIQFACK